MFTREQVKTIAVITANGELHIYKSQTCFNCPNDIERFLIERYKMSEINWQQIVSITEYLLED